ncbi:MAG: hypothetical protein HKN04_00900 [Rhodothermaceae bacterium]|nr:hypothetical protein [Rhodothermaceae bacterium]
MLLFRTAALSGLLIAPILLLAGCTPRIYSTRPYPAYARVANSGVNARYVICHKERNALTLPEPAIRAHLRHGDYFGSCSRENRRRHDDHYRGNRGRGDSGR